MNRDIKHLLSIIEDNGGKASIVGGFVRDSLLGVESNDVDITSDILPEDIIEIFTREKIKAIPTGIEFGTVTLVYEGSSYEVTTLRTDVNCDGRHAEVAFGESFEDDAKRRDFTFNALYMDKSGEITDFFDGAEDLKAGIVRFIGEADDRITEDYLRILRFYRFMAGYGKNEVLEEDHQACIRNKQGLQDISGERIRQELMKLFSYKKPLLAIQKMNEGRVLEEISDIYLSEFQLQAIEKYYDVAGDINPLVTIFIILNDVNTLNNIDMIFHRWRLSKKEKNHLILLHQASEINWDDDFAVRNLMRVNDQQDFLEFLDLNFALCKLSEEQYSKLKDHASNYSPPTYPIKAKDLMDRGIKAGKEIGDLLKQGEIFWEKENYQPDKNDVLEHLLRTDRK